MLIYFIMLSSPVVLRVLVWGGFLAAEGVVWFSVWLFFSIVIGGRYEVGVDWSVYFSWYYLAEVSDFFDAMSVTDPAYAFLNWVAAYFGGGIALVNLVCGGVFMYGLIRYCRGQTAPWLSFYVAIPYLIIVVVMGYSRQGVAIGIYLLGLVWLARGRSGMFLMAIFLASLFHKSAMLMAPLFLLCGGFRERGSALFLLLMVSLLMLFLPSAVESWTALYVDGEMESSGAWARILMNCVPFVIFLILRKGFDSDSLDLKIIIALGWASIAVAPFLMFWSTAVDRMALYFLPLQISLWPRVVYSMVLPEWRVFAVFCLCLIYAASLLVWLLFATHSGSWVPYRFFL